MQLSGAARASVLPLVMDLSNPSPALGWGLEERRSLVQRGPADLVMALALVHHLAISNNVPLPQLAQFFAAAGRRLVIEFVPKEDSQTQKLLRTRRDIFDDYSVQGFERAFEQVFHLRERVAVAESKRMRNGCRGNLKSCRLFQTPPVVVRRQRRQPLMRLSPVSMRPMSAFRLSTITHRSKLPL